jgi:hypothetical protein
LARRRQLKTKVNETQEDAMKKRYYFWFFLPALFYLLFLGFTLIRPSQTRAQEQYPIMDKVANKVIQKYEQSSCQQLQQKQNQKAPPGPEEIRAIQLLHNDAQMRVAFINKVAPPIVNKLFDCGLIP